MDQFIPLSSLASPKAPWHVRRKELIAASPERVWRALTDPEELRLWWSDTAEVDLRPGGRYAFQGAQVYDPERAATETARTPPPENNFEIIEVVPGARLEFRWWLGAVETRVEYELLNHLEQTDLTVTQAAERAPGWLHGFEMPNWWWVALPALRSYVEKGRAGLRVDYAAMQHLPEILFRVEVSTYHWIIWHKLTDPRELERWWARSAEVDLRLGGAFRLGLEGMGPRQVVEVQEGRRLVHDWVWRDGTAGRVEWLVEETDEDTLLSVRDSGPWDAGLPRDAFLIYWSATLLNLKHVSERGITPREYQDA